METPNAICNSWYYEGGVKRCAHLNAMGCIVTGNIKCGMMISETPLQNPGSWECLRCHKINAWFVRQCDCPAPTITANTQQ